MAADKKEKRIQSFSAEDVTKSLNRVVTSRGKKTPAELQGLVSLLKQAVAEKKISSLSNCLRPSTNVAKDEAFSSIRSTESKLPTQPAVLASSLATQDGSQWENRQ